jgi:hypothetical protein
MRGPIITFVPVTLGLVIGGLTMVRNSALAAEDCIEQPNTQAPPGGHWYYHTDRATNRKCWVLRTDDGQVQGTQDTSDGTNEDTQEPRQRASRTPSQVPPPLPLRAPQSPSQAPLSQDSQQGQPPTGPMSSAIEYNDPAFTPFWLRGSLTPVGSVRSAGPSPFVQPVPTAPIPVPQEPVTQVPATDDAAGQTASTGILQPAPQVVVEQTQAQIAPSTDDANQAPTGGSAIELLQKAFQRLTAPAAPGTEPNHTLALMISALALLTIGAGIVITARWSLHRERKRRRALQWDARAQNANERDFSAATLDGADLHEQEWREPHWRDRDQTEQEFVERAAIQPGSDQDGVPYGLDDQHAPHHFFGGGADGAREMRDAPPTGHHQPFPPHGLLYHRDRSAEASRPPAAPPPEAPLSTQAVEDTLRQLLKELDTSRSGRSASPRTGPVMPDVPKAPTTPDTYGAKRPNRGRMRLA